MSDVDFLAPLQVILARDGRFGHRQHLELAWQYVRAAPLDEAEGNMHAAVRRVAALHGAPGTYHVTLTTFWLRLVALHMADRVDGAFEGFISANVGLLDKSLAIRHFCDSTLFSDAARSLWVEPDRLRLQER